MSLLQYEDVACIDITTLTCRFYSMNMLHDCIDITPLTWRFTVWIRCKYWHYSFNMTHLQYGYVACIDITPLTCRFYSMNTLHVLTLLLYHYAFTVSICCLCWHYSFNMTLLQYEYVACVALKFTPFTCRFYSMNMLHVLTLLLQHWAFTVWISVACIDITPLTCRFYSMNMLHDCIDI
jgi:hypothetical protein